MVAGLCSFAGLRPTLLGLGSPKEAMTVNEEKMITKGSKVRFVWVLLGGKKTVRRLPPPCGTPRAYSDALRSAS